MNKRLQLLFFLLMVIASAFIWRKPITSHVVKLGFKYFSEKALGEKISFHDFQYQKNQLILFEPKLGFKSRVIQKGGVYLEAELITLHYQIDWWKRSLKLNLEFLNPKIQIVKTAEYQPDLGKLFVPNVKSVQIETSFRVQNGQLKLIDKSNPNKEFTQDFQFESESRNVQLDHTVVSLSLLQNQSACFGLLSLRPESINYNFDLKEVEIAELQDMINFWTSKQTKEERSLSCSAGVVNGVIGVTTSQSFMPILQTQLAITDLYLKDRKTFLATQIPKADIHLITNKIAKQKNDYSFKDLLEIWADSSQGAVEIPSGAKIFYQENNLEILKFFDMKGQITFNPHDPIKVHLNGNVSTGNRHSLLTIDGTCLFKILKANLEIRMKNHFKDEARIRCSIDPGQENEHKLYVQLSNFSEDEADFVQQLLLPFYPEVRHVEIQKGHLNANLFLGLKNLQPQFVSIEDFQILGGYLNHCEWIEYIHNVRASGNVHLDLNQKNPLKTLKGELQFQADEIKAFHYPFEKLDGYCQLLDGKIVQAQSSTIFSGLKSQIDWLQQREVDPLQIRIAGSGKHFLSFAPSIISKSYTQWFSQESTICEIAGILEQGSLNLKGKCSIGSYRPVFFGFNIHKRKINTDSNEQFRIFWQNFITPLKTVPALSYFERKFNLHLTTNYTLQNGWFHIEEVPVEKFVSPIVFDDTSLTLNGSANIRGEFDQQGLSLSYDHFDLNLDHPSFSIFFKEGEKKKEGHHYFNFTTGSHFGNVHLDKGTFLFKSNNMLFENLAGHVEITPDYIYVPKLFSSIDNLTLSSSFKLQFSQQGDLDLHLKLDKFESKLSELTSLLNSMGYINLNQWPINGYLKIGSEQAFFELNRKGEEIKTRIALGGEMVEGSAPFFVQQPLTNIKCKFNFDSQLQTFEIKEFEGQWRSHRKQDYYLSSNYLKMNLFNDEPCHFDIKVKNAYKDCARLMGKVYFNISQKKPLLKIILDQKNNHIGNVDLTNVYFALNESFRLDYLNVNFSSNLGFIQHDVSLLQNIMPGLSTTSVAALHALSLDGDVSGQWVYDLKQKRHQFFIWGDQVKISQSPRGFFQLKGYQEKNSVFIEDLTYHELKGEVVIEEKPFCYFIRKLKLKTPQGFDLNISGIYCKIFNSFQADIHRLFCNLDQIKNVNLFTEIPYFSKSSGAIAVKGKLEGGYFKGDFHYGLDFKGETSNLNVDQILLKNDKIEGRIEGNSNLLNIAHLKSQFLDFYHHPLSLSVAAKNIEFRKDKPIKIENIHFSFPVQDLPSLRTILKEHWQLEMPPMALEFKKEGLLEGSLHLDPMDPNYYFNLNLEAGNYYFFNKNYHLDSCNFDYGPSGLQIKVQTKYAENSYWLTYNKQSFKKNAFQLFIYDHNPEKNPSKKLKIECQEEADSFLIKSISGSLSGLRFDFVHRPEKDGPSFNVLMGQLQINGEQLVHSLSTAIQEKLAKLRLGKGYFLTGQLTLFKSNLQDFVFEGLFGGQDFELLGFEFKSLSSSLRCTKDQLEIKDFKLSDLSGELSADTIKLDKGQFIVPKVRLKDFKPSLLHCAQEGPVKHKPLIIDAFEISNLKGNLADLNSIRGDGFLTFQKSPKKHTTLLDLPVHLISKLGLDLTMLNPVEGKVMFILKDQKVILTKLVDVYSHDRHCHFTLAKSPELSYLNFDGSLNIKIKMKQYVLLKFTEPFIISVQGSYTAPRYSFMRKKVVVDVFENSSL